MNIKKTLLDLVVLAFLIMYLFVSVVELKYLCKTDGNGKRMFYDGEAFWRLCKTQCSPDHNRFEYECTPCCGGRKPPEVLQPKAKGLTGGEVSGIVVGLLLVAVVVFVVGWKLIIRNRQQGGGVNIAEEANDDAAEAELVIV